MWQEFKKPVENINSHCQNIIVLNESSLEKQNWEKNALFEIIQLLYYFIKCVAICYTIL